MNIKKTIISATVALTMVAMIAPMTAGAVTVAELQAQINALNAQLQSASSAGVPAACVGVTFSRNLKVGSTGADVKCFQVLLNTHGYVLAKSGAGSPGNETSYFGPKTLASVKDWQVAQGWAPANQVGPLSRAKFNSWLTGTSTPTTPTTPTTQTPTGAGLTVSLASDTPVSNAVVSNAALVPLQKITFFNGDNAQVKVTSLKLHRTGVSADASLNNVYLFQGANRLTDSASVSSGLITFNDPNGLFMVPAMGSVSVSVYSDLAASAGETLTTSLWQASDVVSKSSSVNGTFPITGNLMAVATATLAGVNFNSSTTPSSASINPMTNTVVWENLTSITTRSVWFKWLRLREIGTINYADLQNFRLYVDGVMVGSAVQNLDSNGYVSFDLTAAPISLQTGTRDIKVLGDVIGGSNRNFTMSLRVVADANFVDSQYASSVLAQANSTTFSARTTGTQTVNSGTITVQKASDSPAGNVTNLASNQVLAKYIFTAAGEKVKIDTLTAAVISSRSTVGCLRNGALFANGVQIGSTSDLYTTTNTTCTSNTSATSKAFTLGSSLIVDPLAPVTVEIRGDIYDNDGSNGLVTGDTLQAELLVGSANGQGQISLTTSNVPTATTVANQMTVKTGALTLAKYTAYTNANAVAPLTNMKLAHFTLNNDTVEPINLTAIEADLNTVSGYATNLYVMYGTEQTQKIATPAATNSFSIFKQLMPNTTIDVMVYTDINSSASGTGIASVEFCGTTANSATAVYTNSGTTCANGTLAGQTITFTTGSVSSAVDAGTPLNVAVSGGQSVVAAKYKVTASNDSFVIHEMKFRLPSTAASAVATSASLYDGATLVATQPFNTTGSVANDTAFFTGLTIPVAANTYKSLSVSLTLATPYTDGTTITTGKNLQLTMKQLKVANSQGVETTSTPTNAGNYVYVYKSVPTFTALPLTSQSANLSSGSTTDLYKFKVAADAKGPIALKQLKFSITANDAGTAGNLSLGTFKFFRGSTDITTSVTIQNTSAATLESTNSIGEVAGTVVIVTFDTEEQISAGSSYDYTLKATPAGFVYSTTGSDSVSTRLLGDSTPAGGSAGDAATLFYLSSASDTGIQTLHSSANAGGGSTASNVIWSDNSAQVHNNTIGTSTSADWFNGYLINNLPLDSAGIIAQ